jgi:methionyl aminopeptidase
VIHRKSARDLDRMAAAGAIVAETLGLLAESARPGMSTLDLDQIAERHIRAAGGVPTFKGYRGFPGSICASPNTMIVHGIPSDEIVLAEGDILSVDVGVTRQGFVGDSAVTIAIGEVPERTRELLRTCQASLQAAVGASVTSARPCRAWWRPPGSPSCATSSATASAAPCTRIRRSRTTVRPGRAPSSRPA